MHDTRVSGGHSQHPHSLSVTGRPAAVGNHECHPCAPPSLQTCVWPWCLSCVCCLGPLERLFLTKNASCSQSQLMPPNVNSKSNSPLSKWPTPCVTGKISVSRQDVTNGAVAGQGRSPENKRPRFCPLLYHCPGRVLPMRALGAISTRTLTGRKEPAGEDRAPGGGGGLCGGQAGPAGLSCWVFLGLGCSLVPGRGCNTPGRAVSWGGRSQVVSVDSEGKTSSSLWQMLIVMKIILKIITGQTSHSSGWSSPAVTVIPAGREGSAPWGSPSPASCDGALVTVREASDRRAGPLPTTRSHPPTHRCLKQGLGSQSAGVRGHQRLLKSGLEAWHVRIWGKEAGSQGTRPAC